MYSGGWYLISAIFGTSELRDNSTSATGSAAIAQKKDRRLSLLTPEEKELYEKIVRDLVKNCTEHERKKTDSKAKGTPTHWIIFRQAESWDKVEKLLLNVPREDGYIDVWAERWLSRIANLRGLQNRIHLQAKELVASKDNSEHKRKDIATLKLRIKDELELAKKELETEIADRQLLQFIGVRSVFKFMIEHWRHLNVFKEWAEVPMDCTDSRKLFVQVREPHRSHKHKAALLVNVSTKGIFTIEELDPDSKELGVTNQNIGQSPATHRRSSSVALRAEIFNHHYVDNGVQISSIGDRLHTIVNLALDQVNAELAKLQGTQNLSPPSSTSEVPRTDLFYRLFGNDKEYEDRSNA